MGIDYSSSKGIGYEVSESDEIADTDDLEDGLSEYIDNECSVAFKSFEVNSGYDTETTGVYFVLDKPFKYGLDLTKAKKELDAEVKRLKAEG